MTRKSGLQRASNSVAETAPRSRWNKLAETRSLVAVGKPNTPLPTTTKPDAPVRYFTDENAVGCSIMFLIE